MRYLILALTCCWLGTVLAGCDATLREAAILAPATPRPTDPVQEPTDVTDANCLARLQLEAEEGATIGWRAISSKRKKSWNAPASRDRHPSGAIRESSTASNWIRPSLGSYN